MWYTLCAFSILYARLNYARLRKVHKIELTCVKGGVSVLVLTFLLSFLLSQAVNIISLILTHVYGYWPLSNFMWKGFAWFGIIGEDMYFKCLFVALLARYVVIFKECGSKLCQKMYKYGIQGSWFMAVVLLFVSLYSNISLRLPHILHGAESGFSNGDSGGPLLSRHFGHHGRCKFLFYTHEYYPNNFYVISSTIPICVITFSLIFTGFFCLTKHLSNLPSKNKSIRQEENRKFSLEVSFLATYALLLHIFAPAVFPFSLCYIILVSIFNWLLTIYVSFSIWHLLKLVIQTVLKDIFCCKSRDKSSAVDLEDLSFSE